jgi:hypothetical protein
LPASGLLRKLSICCLVTALTLLARPSAAADGPRSLAQVSLQDIQQAAVALVHVVTTPEVESAIFRVDRKYREADLSRSTAGFGTDFLIYNQVFDGYWGAALSTGTLDETFELTGSDGEPVLLDIERDVESAQLSAGLALPFTGHFKLRPYISGSYIRLDSDTDILAGDDALELPPGYLTWSADGFSTTATLEGIYDQWQDNGGRLQLVGVYSLAYLHNESDIEGDVERSLDNSGWGHTLELSARWSAPTGLYTRGRPWRWSTYLSHTNFIDLEKEALGFSYYFELGGGISYEVNVRPLDWFGIRFIGFEAGLILGEDVDGYSVGISFQ